uniref:Ig-like domain-containing protein n=1 Tax=Cyprinus carpio TaxID=7962 RepID=A0A8C1M8P8_CYPCA
WCGLALLSCCSAPLECWIVVGVLSSISVTGYSGGGVIITCRYEGKYTANEKYFCKEETLTCSDLIKTGIKNQWFKSGGFSLYDNTSTAVFTVILKDLSEQDSGMYKCGVDKSKSPDSYTKVNLNVVTVLINVTGTDDFLTHINRSNSKSQLGSIQQITVFCPLEGPVESYGDF